MYAVLGTSNTNDIGYIKGVIDHLKSVNMLPKSFLLNQQQDIKRDFFDR